MPKTCLVMFVYLITIYYASNAQNYMKGSSCAEVNCNQTTNCIGKYVDLEKYLLNNQELIGNLTEVFFL